MLHFNKWNEPALPPERLPTLCARLQYGVFRWNARSVGAHVLSIFEKVDSSLFQLFSLEVCLTMLASAFFLQSSICPLLTTRFTLWLFYCHINPLLSTTSLSRINVGKRACRSMLHDFVMMPHETLSHSTLETQNPERALFDSYQEVTGQASLESPRHSVSQDSRRNTLKPQTPVQAHHAELPADVRGNTRNALRNSTRFPARRNRVTVACLGVALAGIIITAAVIGMKTSQHGWSHSSISSVAPSSVSTRLSSSQEQIPSRLKTTTSFRTETPSRQLHTSSSLSSANIHQSRDSAITQSSSMIYSQEPLPSSKYPTLFSNVIVQGYPITRSYQLSTHYCYICATD